MSDDLVKKLRDPAFGFPDCFHQAAADEIETQAAEIARLCAAINDAEAAAMAAVALMAFDGFAMNVHLPHGVSCDQKTVQVFAALLMPRTDQGSP